MGKRRRMWRVQAAIIVGSTFLVAFASLASAQVQHNRRLRAGLPPLKSSRTIVASVE